MARMIMTQKQDGFILMEALAAVMICSLALLAVMRLSADNLRAQYKAEQKILAVLEAQGVMEKARSVQPLVPSHTEEPLQDLRTAKIDVAPYDDQGLFLIKVDVVTQQGDVLSSLQTVKSNGG